MRRALAPLLAVFVAFVLAAPAAAQVCAAAGKDGPVTGLTGILNTYYPGTANVAAGGTSISVGAATGAATALAPGDMVLIIQMQDGVNAANFPDAVATYTTAASTAGTYEYRLVAAFSAGVVTLHNGTTNAYSTATGVGVARKTFQVIRVPQYSTATLPAGNTVTPLVWNGSTGGVVAIDTVGTFTLNGTINAAGYGFRGGAGRIYGGGGTNTNTTVRFSSTNTNGAMKGEGTAGSPASTFASVGAVYTWAGAGGDFYPNGDNGYGAPGNAGGGGNDGNVGGNDENSGGGGGGGAGAGGQGGNSWNSNLNIGGRGGAAIASNATRAVMGGGGGAATSNNGTGGQDATYSGASGGGIVMMRAGAFAGTGTINAAGSNGQIPNASCCDDGGTGGGGGGAIILLGNTTGGMNGIIANARGGNGSRTPNQSGNHGPGGGGGGGAVLSNAALSGTSSVAGGARGTSTWNASAGNAGVISTALAFNGGNGALPGGDPLCRPVLTVSKVTTTPIVTIPTENTAQYSIAVTNAATAAAAWGVSVNDILPTPFVLSGTSATATFSAASGPATPAASGTSVVQIGTSGGTAANSFLVRPGGAVTVTFNVSVATGTAGTTYQNPATVQFSDPTRTAAATTVTVGNTYAGGGTVGGSNYASASSTAEDVFLRSAANLSVIKSDPVTSVAAGGVTTYTISVVNAGPGTAAGVQVKDAPTAGLSCGTVSCAATAANMCPAASMPFTSLTSGVNIGPAFPASSTATFTVTCGVTATGQ